MGKIDNNTLNKRFSKLNTPQIADACVRLGIDFKLAPPGIRTIIDGTRLAGRSRPVKHYGSVDIFFEAMLKSDIGDVLIIDNKKRHDEGCIGDLTAIEAKVSGLAGIIVWGYHRDTMDLIKLGLPVFSYGSCPAGPLRIDLVESNALEQADFGGNIITKDNVVFADEDGVIFTDWDKRTEIVSTAENILETERKQAEEVSKGNLLRNQFHFEDFLKKRKNNPDFTFRKHLKIIGGAIEE
jgi:4-hydroxy-4-methyl-2-oxoglutarate aldolase